MNWADELRKMEEAEKIVRREENRQRAAKVRQGNRGWNISADERALNREQRETYLPDGLVHNLSGIMPLLHESGDGYNTGTMKWNPYSN
jgi:hypothetical protein